MNYRLANQHLVRLVLAVAAALVLAVSVGAVTARALTHQPAPQTVICPIASHTPTTPTGRLIRLGFHPTEANRLIRQMSGLGFQQRYAAERIAYATEWGGAYAFGPTHYIQPR